jgi:hypothetical protein
MDLFKEILHQALVHVKNDPNKMKNYGICGHVNMYMSHTKEYRCVRHSVNALLDRYINRWPVKLDGAEHGLSPIPNYWEECAERTLWDNPKRLELLDWLIEQTEGRKDDTEQHHDSSTENGAG